MANLEIQQGDWKKEKHTPVIEAPDTVEAGKIFQVKVTLGQEIAHPNTTEHHISWISLYFHPEGKKFPHHVGHFEFSAHGESPAGANQGPVYTHHEVLVSMKISAPGTLHAVSMCNIHGLWESDKPIGIA
ncbi:MAG TPA: Neelaredoxin [Anaerolineales bacterium]|nr:Neelaredoxin [Anaerolineales bacterium]